MVRNDNEYSYLIAVNDIDKSLLPSHARTPGTDAFREEVTRLIERDYRDFGGFVRIVVGPEQIEVVWRRDKNAPDPLVIAVAKLKEGDYDNGVRLLELLRRQQPDNVTVLYNLGMALSDLGRLQESEQHLRHASATDPANINAAVALGVALARQGRDTDAISVLQQAADREPSNQWAARNLGACLLRTGEFAEAVSQLRRAVDLDPNDPQSLFGLAQALHATGEEVEADELYVRTIDIDPRGPTGEAARNERSKLAQQTFQGRAVGGIRPDAVMYLLGAIEKFEKMRRDEVQQVGIEIAVLGQRGIDPNDADKKYNLRSMPGSFSGLHLLCLMFVAFKTIAPEHSIGFDLSKEFEVAKSMHTGGGEA